MKKMKCTYILFSVLLIALALGLCTSFAFLTNKLEQKGKLNIVAGTLNYKIESDDLVNNEITLEAGQTKEILIKLISLNSIDSKYELYYKTDTNDIIVGYGEDSSSAGTIDSNGTETINVIIQNKSNNEQTITFGVKSGLINNELALADTETSLIDYCSDEHVYTFDYTGNSQEFITLCSGDYKVELWGASGSIDERNIEGSNGLGAYTSGNITLTSLEHFLIYVGGSVSGYNGGAYAESSGGGATDLRLVLDNLNSRIMVAGGGGGGMYKIHATVNETGDAGGLLGYDADATIANHPFTTGYSGKGATQSAGGATGIHGNYEYTSTMDGTFGQGGYNATISSSGGGGWYGGGHGRHAGGTWPGGGGGSSYISGHAGCLAVSSSDSVGLIQGCDETSNSLRCSISYTGYYFTNTIMIDGRGYKWTTEKGTEVVGMPNHNNTATMTGNSGNGYAKITYLGE